MRLHSLTYAEHEGTPQEWRLDGLVLGARNLIVGKNATGKSRTLNIISALSRHLAGLQPPALSGNYDCTFSGTSATYRYEVRFEDEKVTRERLTLDNIVRLDRGSDGAGVIYAEELDGGKDLRFQAPTSQFAAIARRDSIQHKFLEPLFQWASSVRHVYFGTSFGKDTLTILVPKGTSVVPPPLDDRDPNAVVPLFRTALKEYPDTFLDILKADLARVDYHVSEVGVQPPISVRFQGIATPPVALFVRETDLPGVTDQHSMSQGMYRVLALLIHINYHALRKTSPCLLIDDIGEGLDFDRSCRLIDLLREKAATTDTQLIFTTNDRFVMNRVPLEEWSVLQRRSNNVTVRNYENSKKVFEEFKFTGLGNFSFLEMDVINDPEAGKS